MPQNYTYIYVVRHCEAQGNIERFFQGHTDGYVSENGLKQLDRLAERFRGISIDVIYTSPLTRTRTTAEALNRYHGCPVFYRHDLIELNGGVWEGKVWKDLPQMYPEDARNWNLAPHKFQAENGEHMYDLFLRISKAVTEIAKENAGKTVAISTHGCAIRNLICWAKGFEHDKLIDVDWSDNTAVSLIRFNKNLTPEVIFAADASHLDGDLSTLGKQSWWRPENREKLVFD